MEFGKGGRLPGLVGGNRDSNPGFTNRMMWRSHSSSGGSSGDATAPVGPANLVYYTHYLGLDNELQDDFKWEDSANANAWLLPTTGEWHTITQQVVLGTAANNYEDGVIRGYKDGVPMSEETNLKLSDGTHQIEQFYFSTFFGGSDPSWEPGTDQNIYFDNFTVSATAIAVPEPSGAFLAAMMLAMGLRFRRRPRRHHAREDQ